MTHPDPVDLPSWSVEYGTDTSSIEEYQKIFQRSWRLPGSSVVLLTAVAGRPAARLYSLCCRTFHCSQCCLSGLRLLLWGTLGAELLNPVLFMTSKYQDSLFQQVNYVTLKALPSHFHVLLLLFPMLWCTLTHCWLGPINSWGASYVAYGTLRYPTNILRISQSDVTWLCSWLKISPWNDCGKPNCSH